MIDKAWYKLMGLTEAAFNKNFYVAVVLVLLVTNGTALWFWEQSIRRVENNLKERVVIIQIIEKEKHLIQEKCDSLRYLDLRYFEKQTDSLGRLVYQILREKRENN